MTEKYCFTVSEDGQKSLNILEKGFNDQTKYFLNKHGLKPGLSVLDIGCGLGYMSQYLAEIVGKNGFVTAIDNSENQIKAAKARCPENLKSRINWVVADLYALEKLNKTFDMVYCRFVLHHVHKSRQALTQIAQVIKPGGIYIGIEGIVNYAYSYPEHSAWPQLNFPIEVAEGENRNSNIGKILPNLITQTGMKCIESFIFQPLLIEPNIRQLLLQNECIDNKEHLLNENHMTEKEWQKKYDDLKACIEDETTLLGFYAANFTASRK
jgi:ubiquinone/menaquinone biosynthesis C-methylase UbiE